MEFFKEALTVSKLKHENIVQFYGIILDIEDCLIMEFMGGGELLDYLKSNGRSLTFDDQIKMCFDIVKGCTYLEEKKFVHRDLAARNCLLSSSDPTERIVIYIFYYFFSDYLLINYYLFRYSMFLKLIGQDR